MQDAGQLSPDGKWRWEGTKWVPAPPPALAMRGGNPPADLVRSVPTNTLAIVSLAASILSWVLFPVAGALVGIVTGYIARGQIRRSGEAGAGLALWGLIIGYAHMVVVTAAAVIWVAVVGGFIYALFSGGSH